MSAVTTKPIHGAPQPRIQFSDEVLAVSPVDCGLVLGDVIIYTNDYGCVFDRGHAVIGFCHEPTSWGATVYIDHDSWWCPVKRSCLQKKSA